jgi:hypothetical protein
MFAAGAAHMRGVPVAEVCTVYGVALPAALQTEQSHHDHHHHGEHSGHEDHSKHAAAAHAGDHCALTALAALAVPDTTTPVVAPPYIAATFLRHDLSVTPPDAVATWAARRKHGPPFLA